MKPRPTDEEFEELARKRDAGIAEVVKATAAEMGWNPAEVKVHVSGSGGCYCDCPDGPCQHIWDGPPWEDEGAWSTTCSRCGAVAMFHDMRFAP